MILLLKHHLKYISVNFEKYILLLMKNNYKYGENPYDFEPVMWHYKFEDNYLLNEINQFI